MTDNPYINKQNWGRDLLDRLNNFSDDDGSFNVWDEFPTTGKDGQTLSQNHAGYTGIVLLESFSRLVKWNGDEWITLLEIPFKSSANISQDTFFERGGTGGSWYFHPSLGDESIIELSHNNNGSMSVARLSKSGSILWQTSLVLPSSCLIFGSPGLQVINNMVLIRIIPVLGTTFVWTETLMEFLCLSFDTGALLWRTPLTKVNNVIGMGNWCVGKNQNLVYSLPIVSVVRVDFITINPSNGAVLSTSNISGFSGLTTGLIFYDQVSDSYLFGGKGFDVLMPVSLYRLSNSFVVLQEISLGTSADFYTRNEWDNWLIYSPSTREAYFFRKISGVNTLSKYSISSSQVTNIASTTEDLGFLYCVDTVAEAYYFSKRYAVIKAKISSGIIELDSINLLSKYGLLNYPIDTLDIAGRNLSLAYFKINSVIFGGNTQTSTNYVYFSYGTNPYVLFDNAYLADTLKLTSFNAGFNVDTFSCQKLLSGYTQTTSIVCSKTSLATESINTIPTTKVPGISTTGIVGNFHLFAGELSSESQTYVAASRRTRTAGLLFGAENRAGRIFHGWNTDGAGGLFYDHTAARILLCNSGGESAPRVMKTSFPNSNGLVVDSANNFGIGTYSPAFKLDVNGEMRATVVRNSGGVITSDPRLKVNMLSLAGEDLWSVCQQLNPITFLYKPDFEVKINEVEKDESGNDVISVISQKWPLPQGIQYGYNAAEVELLFPELVSEDPQGIKYLNSGALFPIFQSAATAKIQSLESEVESLKQLVQSLVARIEVLENA